MGMCLGAMALTLILLFFISTSMASNDTAPSADKSSCLLQRDRGEACPSSSSPSPSRHFYYDKSTRYCQPFQFTGCGGNANRFPSLQECQSTCTDVPESSGGGGDHGHGLVIPVPKCEGGVRAAVNGQSQPLECDECPQGHTCGQEGHCCPTKEHTCALEYDTGKYAAAVSHTPRYFYNPKVDNCLLFTYYGALGNANNFETYNQCVGFCKGKVHAGGKEKGNGTVVVEGEIIQ